MKVRIYSTADNQVPLLPGILEGGATPNREYMYGVCN
jgi:hypothetical protein